ncbi:UDP-N-acetylglucosamine 2-epimerase [Methylogaea oryzae]|uniref:UDP-N-acetylglucosamine 2-epimerase n=1 Tax=Methylogaea oryzae TaxID=1295382 RepID=UPI000B1F5E81|nr:UDP-N-acetylglucosamine 2-epimerase [Methylogaea oryzae]
MAELFAALEGLGQEVGLIFTKPNADAGGQAIAAAIDAFVAAHPNAVAHTSLGQQRYYSLMAQVDAVVGNSSSGLYEAPSFGLPTVNIGDRQKGRLRAASVIDCPARREAIAAAIAAAWSLDCSEAVNPYGDGQAAGRILESAARCQRTAAFVAKTFPRLAGKPRQPCSPSPSGRGLE